MEASAIKHPTGVASVRPRTPLLRMQSDERLVTLVRRGNDAAFGVLVGRYESRLLAFCRHLLRSREDAEDVLQDVFASAFKAMLADDRPIRVRPWLYRIARNRCLNHLRRISAIGVDSIEDHFSEHGPSTSETVQRREDLRLLVRDIQELSEAQRSALLLREMEALSYEQIADVMDKTIPSVKSLLIRARRSLAESAEARSLSCTEVVTEIEEVQAGVRDRISRVVRRHMGSCERCSQLEAPEHALQGIRLWLPLGPLYLLKRLGTSQLLHSARTGSTATAAGAGAAAGPSLLAGPAASGFISAGIGGLAGKAAVGLTAAALGVAGAAVVDTTVPVPKHSSQRSESSVAVDHGAPLATAYAAVHRAAGVAASDAQARAQVGARQPKAATRKTSTVSASSAPKTTSTGSVTATPPTPPVSATSTGHSPGQSVTTTVTTTSPATTTSPDTTPTDTTTSPPAPPTAPVAPADPGGTTSTGTDPGAGTPASTDGTATTPVATTTDGGIGSTNPGSGSASGLTGTTSSPSGDLP